jgi:hypothetical protein
MKTILLTFVLFVLAACQPATPDAAAIQTAIAQTQAVQPSPTIAASPTLLPTNSSTPTNNPIPTQRSANATAPAQPPKSVVYYHFVFTESNFIPADSVVISPGILILAPKPSGKARSPDTAANISSALTAMIYDPQNVWTSSNLVVTNVTANKGAVNVVLQGKIFAAGDAVFVAIRMQYLMTVFAEASVQTAIITIGGENIANLGNSGPGAEPADYTYTRADIEAFMTKNAYKAP